MNGITEKDVEEYFAEGVEPEFGMAVRDVLLASFPLEEPKELEEPAYWIVEDNSKALQLGGEIINLIHRGPTQLKQIGLLKEFLEDYAKPIVGMISPEGKLNSGGNGVETAINFLVGILEPDALIKLGSCIIMKDAAFVEEQFDIGWVIDGASIILKNQPALRKITSGFFGKRG